MPPETQRSPDGATCPECGTVRAGDWCAGCGRPHVVPRLTFRGAVATAIAEILDLEQPLVRTVVLLTIRPGRTCRDYVLGERRRLVNPLKYCLLAAAIHTLAMGLLGVSPMPDLDGIAEAASSEGGRAVERMNATMDWIFEYQGLLNILVLPVMAGLCRLIFIDRRVNLAEWYAVHLYAWGHLYVLTFPLLVLGWLETLPGTIVNLGLPFVIVPVTVSGFLRDRRMVTLVMAVGALLAYFTLVVVASTAAGGLAAILGR